LKPERNLYNRQGRLARFCSFIGVVLAAEIGLLLLAALILWQDSGFGGGWRLAIFICCLASAMSAIWLVWYWYKLSKEITSVAEQLCQPKAALPDRKHYSHTLTGRILTAIDKHLHGYDESVSELNEQIKELKIQLRVLKRQRLNMESIIYGIRDAVIVTDQSDKLLIANETAGRLFNFDYRHSQYKNIEQLLDKNKFNLTDLLQKSRKSRTRHTKYELEIGCNGEIKTFDCVVSCIFDESQNVCGVVAILHDITREKQAARMKNDFVSHVSHELKTPLASISAYAEMLVDGEANNEEMRKEFYSVIQSQARRLNRLIEDILNISRIESGLVKVDKKLVSLAMVIREQMQMIKGYTDEKNIKIIVPEPILYDQIYGDKDMISQVVVNLLSNAVKYTPDGGTVTIGIEVDESEKLARVSITDTGVGIPEEEIGSIFRKFYRVKANQNVAKGTGLGLNLVKQIIEKVHNGRIFVRSKVGVGSTFGFELPLAGARAAEEKIKV